MKYMLTTKMTIAFLITVLMAPCYLLKAQRGGINRLSRGFNKSVIRPPKPFRVRKTQTIESFPKAKNTQTVGVSSQPPKLNAKRSFNVQSFSPKQHSNIVKEFLPTKASGNTKVATGRLKNKNYQTLVAAKKQNQQITVLNNIKSKTTSGKINTKRSAKQLETEILSEITDNSSPLLKKEAGYAVRRVREIEAAEIRLTQQKVFENARKTNAQNPRNMPGIVSFGDKAVSNPKEFGIPKSVVEKMLNQKYGAWGNFRRALNREISKTPEAQKYFKKADLTEMAKGNNPFANIEGVQGKRRRLEWDHYFEIRDGHSPYDLSNLRLITPRTHVNKIGRKFNLASENK